MPSDLGANENSKINNSTAFDKIDNGSLATMGGRDGRTLEPFQPNALAYVRFNIPHGNTLRKPFISNLKGDDVRTRMNEAEIASESSVQKFVNKVSCSRTVPNFKRKRKETSTNIFVSYIIIYTHIPQRCRQLRFSIVNFSLRFETKRFNLKICTTSPFIQQTRERKEKKKKKSHENSRRLAIHRFRRARKKG